MNELMGKLLYLLSKAQRKAWEIFQAVLEILFNLLRC